MYAGRDKDLDRLARRAEMPLLRRLAAHNGPALSARPEVMREVAPVAAASLPQAQIDYIRAQAEQACATNSNCT